MIVLKLEPDTSISRKENADPFSLPADALAADDPEFVLPTPSVIATIEEQKSMMKESRNTLFDEIAELTAEALNQTVLSLFGEENDEAMEDGEVRMLKTDEEGNEVPVREIRGFPIEIFPPYRSPLKRPSPASSNCTLTKTHSMWAMHTRRQWAVRKSTT